MSGEWPYDDALPDHPWTETYRLAVLGNWYPRHMFVVAVVVPTDENAYFKLMMPTDAEAAVLASYQMYRLYQEFPEHHIQELSRRAPLYVTNILNTTIFVKYEDGTWGYTMYNWSQAPRPLPGGPTKFTSLTSLIDHIEHLRNHRWQQWMRDHLDVFARA